MGAISQKSAEFLIRSRLADAEAGDVDALFELGVTFSTGRGGIAVDLIEAHKWFNLAALVGLHPRTGMPRRDRARDDRARNRRSAAAGARLARGDRLSAPRRLSQRTNIVTARGGAGALLAPAHGTELRRRHAQ